MLVLKNKNLGCNSAQHAMNYKTLRLEGNISECFQN
jgi:hypothetical protein